MSQKIQQKPGGNTKPPSSNVQLYCWTWTIPESDFTINELWSLLSQKAKKFTFSLEKGKEKSKEHPDGYRHYQGCMSLHKKEYFKTVKNILGDKAHLEATKSIMGSIKYCEKMDETHIAGPWTQDKRPIKTISVLREWQENMKRYLMTEPDDRTIVWIYDPEGGAGKTKFCKYMAINHGATVVTNGGVKDIAQLLEDDPKIVLWNITRSKETYISYEAIESVKDGMITSAKYESKTKYFECPHVVVFANFGPNEELMSRDRWRIIKLAGGKPQPIYDLLIYQEKGADAHSDEEDEIVVRKTKVKHRCKSDEYDHDTL